MKTLWIEKQFEYDGSQLRSLFAYIDAGVLGDSIVAWQGPCNIPFDKMVDGEDLRAKEKICGFHMVHFIIEKFQPQLGFGVALQRLFASMIKDQLEKSSPQVLGKLFRDGDDIYLVENSNLSATRNSSSDPNPNSNPTVHRKLTISIATVSPVSNMIHFAINVSNKGTPVPTASLEDLNIEPITFARQMMSSFATEMKSIESATQKVFWVK